MAKLSIDVLGELLQDVFSKKEGLKDFLQAVVQQVMETEVTGLLGAERHERVEERSG